MLISVMLQIHQKRCLWNFPGKELNTTNLYSNANLCYVMWRLQRLLFLNIIKCYIYTKAWLKRSLTGNSTFVFVHEEKTTSCKTCVHLSTIWWVPQQETYCLPIQYVPCHSFKDQYVWLHIQYVPYHSLKDQDLWHLTKNDRQMAKHGMLAVGMWLCH